MACKTCFRDKLEAIIELEDKLNAKLERFKKKHITGKYGIIVDPIGFNEHIELENKLEDEFNHGGAKIMNKKCKECPSE